MMNYGKRKLPEISLKPIIIEQATSSNHLDKLKIYVLTN